MNRPGCCRAGATVFLAGELLVLQTHRRTCFPGPDLAGEAALGGCGTASTCCLWGWGRGPQPGPLSRITGTLLAAGLVEGFVKAPGGPEDAGAAHGCSGALATGPSLCEKPPPWWHHLVWDNCAAS